MNVLSIDEQARGGPGRAASAHPPPLRSLECSGFTPGMTVRWRHGQVLGGGLHCMSLDVRRRGDLSGLSHVNPRLPHLGSVMSEPASLVADALLFDLDGVLVDSQRAVQEAMAHWAVSVGLDPKRFSPAALAGATSTWSANCSQRPIRRLRQPRSPTLKQCGPRASYQYEVPRPCCGTSGQTGWAVVTSSARRVAQSPTDRSRPAATASADRCRRRAQRQAASAAFPACRGPTGDTAVALHRLRGL